MRNLIGRLWVVLAITAACQAQLSAAEDGYLWVSGDGPSARAVADEKPAVKDTAYGNCGETACGGQETGCEESVCAAMQPCRVWYIDYRIRSMFNSHTSYEFGTEPGSAFERQYGKYAPVSRLNWSLDSTWNGLQVGIEKPNWDVHFEWLTPMTKNINGTMEDSDWVPANNLILQSHTQQRWNDGQMLDLGGEFKWTEFCLGNSPIEVWPVAGFKWQRFGMTGYDSNYNVGTLPYPFPQPGDILTGDQITTNQQYSIGYIGAQLRTALCWGETPIDLRLQGDWGATSAYNVDHHLGVDKYWFYNTRGDAFHIALTAEAPISCRFSVGLQADHTAIRTTGTVDWVGGIGAPPAAPYSNGVLVKSDQTSLTAFLRARF
jgi:hypothetical protein